MNVGRAATGGATSRHPRSTVSWAAATASIAVITCRSVITFADMCRRNRDTSRWTLRATRRWKFSLDFSTVSPARSPVKGVRGGALTLLRAAAADATVARRFEYAFVIRYSRAHRVRSSTRPVVA